jgi:predicted ribosome quality control (RQC) complex YloA/Tae2 family protein
MRLELKLNKSIEENASMYFDQSKKAKKKLEGIKKILEEYSKKSEDMQNKERKEKEKKDQLVPKKIIKVEWYEKFRWFISSEGLLVIGGRDATTNEIIVKKHMSPYDLVFHTDAPGSPFFIIKSDPLKKITEKTITEAATTTACYSKAWKRGMHGADVFMVKPEQVSKETNSGEFIGKGSFMIHGKKEYVIPEMKIAIGILDGKVIGGPVSAISSRTDKFVVVILGDDKTGDVAKKINKTLGGDLSLDELNRFIPAGGSKIEVKRK